MGDIVIPEDKFVTLREYDKDIVDIRDQIKEIRKVLIEGVLIAIFLALFTIIITGLLRFAKVI